MNSSNRKWLTGFGVAVALGAWLRRPPPVTPHPYLDDDTIDLRTTPTVTHGAATPPRAIAPAATAQATTASRDIEAVNGIGPKIARALRAHGIDSLDILAETSPSEIEHILDDSATRSITPVDSWPDQARELLGQTTDEAASATSTNPA